MINYKSRFKRVESTYKDLEKEYEIFNKRISLENKNMLKIKIKKHREALNELMASLNNMFIR